MQLPTVNKTVNYKLVRFHSNQEETLGYLTTSSGEMLGFTLEDEYRNQKVMRETRIPAGNYEIKQRKELTPLTQRYRNRFEWFDFHLELQNVPNFTGIYIHIGNDEGDTAGCPLLAGKAELHENSRLAIWESTRTFKPFYERVRKELQDGFEVRIQIIDFDFILK